MAQRYFDALARLARMLRFLRSDSGQALTELPIAVLIASVVIIFLLQPITSMYTKMVLGQTAASAVRIVAAQSEEGLSASESTLKPYVADKLQSLPKGEFFWIPGSLKVELIGGPSSDLVRVRISLQQRPLPLIGMFLGKGAGGKIEVSGEASGKSAFSELDGSVLEAPDTYGCVQ
jgi:competence protein ComGC